MKSNQRDYLKYWKVVRYYIMHKYKISNADLDMLLFLNSEDYFSRETFVEFNNLLSWDRVRFERLMREGWIESFRVRRKNIKALYKISYKAKRMIVSLYNKLDGEEIPTNKDINPLFKRDVKYMHKVHRNYIMQLNETIRQQRRLAPE